MKTAPWDIAIYDPSPVLGAFGSSDGNLILCKDHSTFHPVIFCSHKLPIILSCIAREMGILFPASPPQFRATGYHSRSLSGPLIRWYESVLRNIYVDVPSNGSSAAEVPSWTADFCMAAHPAFQLPFSEYRYLSLTLPPLWQSVSQFPVDSAFDASLLAVSRSTTHPEHVFCAFHLEKETGVWYARLQQAGHKKRILGRSDLRRILS